MKFAKIVIIFLLSLFIMPCEVYAYINDNRTVIPKIKRRKQTGRPVVEDVTISIYQGIFTLEFSSSQGMAEISICDVDGKVADTFTATTSAPIEWYMPEYEGYTVTITTDFAVYEAEL